VNSVLQAEVVRLRLKDKLSPFVLFRWVDSAVDFIRQCQNWQLIWPNNLAGSWQLALAVGSRHVRPICPAVCVSSALIQNPDCPSPPHSLLVTSTT
jgi:hypothetical protein